MAELFSCGLDSWQTIADYLGHFDSFAIGQNGTFPVTGLLGSGQAIRMGNTGSAARAWGSNDGTIFFAVRVQAVNSANLFLTFRDGASNQVAVELVQSGGIRVRSGGTTGTIIGETTEALFPVGITRHVMGRLVIHNTAGEAEIRLDAGTSATLLVTGKNTRAGSTSNHVNAFTISVTGIVNNVFTWDDLYINSASGAEPTSWPGDVRVAFCPAAGAGASSDFTPSNGTGPNWQMVDDRNDGDTTYVGSNTVGHQDLYTIAPLPSTPLAIVSTKVLGVWRKEDAGARTAALRQRVSGVESSVVSESGVPTSYFPRASPPAHINPVTGVAWTASDIANMQVGFKVEA